ncbi:MAG TPA: tRNA (adenosine(37)-N6)-threonylcarbamoyltransferase complex ATPase subunit type 1 TsaE [Gammaproteobacteria bacterium]
MGESCLARVVDTEAALAELAGFVARTWRQSGLHPLVVGLSGALGSGKTTWVRAMLRGLGYRGRVPSPTYTLLEHYSCDGLTLVHLDLYRLGGDAELENLGLRDWLGDPSSWILVEWPERALELARRCDLNIAFEEAGGGRRIVFEAVTQPGIEALTPVRHGGSNKPP